MKSIKKGNKKCLKDFKPLKITSQGTAFPFQTLQSAGQVP
jgi:hypothetical protein